MERIEDHNYIVANDTLLPAQFYPHHVTEFAPERMLWANVLLDAIHSVQQCPDAFISAPTSVVGSGDHNRRRKQGLEDKAWLDDDRDTYPGSFLFVCAVLDLQPDDVRKAVGDGVRVARRSPVDFGHRIGANKPRVRHRQSA